MKQPKPSRAQIEDAMWAGNMDWLHENAECVCCCWEHTFMGCPARIWAGCRGGFEGEKSYDPEGYLDWWEALNKGQPES